MFVPCRVQRTVLWAGSAIAFHALVSRRHHRWCKYRKNETGGEVAHIGSEAFSFSFSMVPGIN